MAYSSLARLLIGEQQKIDFSSSPWVANDYTTLRWNSSAIDYKGGSLTLKINKNARRM